jgi:C1A family cysteine protease
MTIRKIKKYGWRKDHLDQRDKIYRAASMPPILPKSVDLQPKCPPVYDQGQLGSCTANAIAGAIEFDLKAQGLTDFVPSRLFIYYNERVIENDVDQDNGAEIRDGIKSVATQGVCPETEWPYSDQGTQFAVVPTPTCYADALKVKALSYQSAPQDAISIKTILASGRPIVFGFSVYESFESDEVASTGMVPMPSPTDSPIGGHAVLAVGYDDIAQRFLVRNSWGQEWGLQGYFKMPYAYLLDENLASDLWVVQTIS